MSGSAPPQVAKHEMGTTAVEISVLIPQDTGVLLLAGAFALPSPNAGPAACAPGAPSIVWRKPAGRSRIVHAFAANSVVDVPLCGSGFRDGRVFDEFPPPPADLGIYRRCRKCMAIAGRQA